MARAQIQQADTRAHVKPDIPGMGSHASVGGVFISKNSNIKCHTFVRLPVIVLLIRIQKNTKTRKRFMQKRIA